MEDLSEASRLIGEAIQKLEPQPQLIRHIEEALKRHGRKAAQGFISGLKDGQ